MVNCCLDLNELADQPLFVVGCDALEQVIQELFVLGEQVSDELVPCVGQGDIEHPAVRLALPAQDQPFFLQFVDHISHGATGYEDFLRHRLDRLVPFVIKQL